jgi:hypothetical protein
MQTRVRDIYNKAIEVIRSCESVYHIAAATMYVDLAIKQIRPKGNKSRSIDLMVSNLKYYLRMKKKAIVA